MDSQSRRTWPAHPHDPVPTAAAPPAEPVVSPPPAPAPPAVSPAPVDAPEDTVRKRAHARA